MLVQRNRTSFSFHHLQMDTNAQINTWSYFYTCTQSSAFFCTFLSCILLAFLAPSLFPSKTFWPTHNGPEKWVKDTQDADTKVSHLIYFSSAHVCQSLLVSLPPFHLYTLQSPCCAHRWYWHMAAAFAVFANLALLLQCLFLLPSGLHSALCKCHSSPVISLGCRRFRVRSVMLSEKNHSNSAQQ